MATQKTTKKTSKKPSWYVRVAGPSTNVYNPPSGELYKSKIHVPFLVQPLDFEYFNKRLAPKKCFIELGADIPADYLSKGKKGGDVVGAPAEIKQEQDAQAEKDALEKGSPGIAANQVQTSNQPQAPPAADAKASKADTGAGAGSE